MFDNITIEIIDKATGKSETLVTNSWVKQAAQMFQGCNDRIDTISMKDEANNTFTLKTTTTTAPFWVKAAANDATQGIIVGTGLTVPDKDNVALTSKIAHGSSSGQLSHGAVNVNAITAITGGYRLTIDRDFTNNSGATITVNEIGMLMNVRDTSNVVKDVLILHDLITVAILNTVTKTLKYHLDFIA